MKKMIIAAAVFVAMVACNKNVIETPMAEYGYINLGITADTDMVLTRALTANDDYNTFNICLYKADGTTPYWNSAMNENVSSTGFIEYEQAVAYTDLWKVPAGNYVIYVENKTIDEVYPSKEVAGEVRVSGTNTVTVFAGLPTETVTVNCTPQNSKVSFVYNDAFDAVFDVVSLNVKNSSASRELAMTPVKVEGEITDEVKNNLDSAYFEPEALTWTLVAENTAGVTKKYTGTFATELAKWSIVTFTTGDVEGTINVTITVDGEISETITVSAEIDPLEGEIVE